MLARGSLFRAGLQFIGLSGYFQKKEKTKTPEWRRVICVYSECKFSLVPFDMVSFFEHS